MKTNENKYWIFAFCHNWTITHHVNMKHSSWWCYHIFPANVLTYCNSGSLLALNAVTVAAIGVNVSQCHVIFSSRKHSFGKGQKMWPWADASVLQQCWAMLWYSGYAIQIFTIMSQDSFDDYCFEHFDIVALLCCSLLFMKHHTPEPPLNQK